MTEAEVFPSLRAMRQAKGRKGYGETMRARRSAFVIHDNRLAPVPGAEDFDVGAVAVLPLGGDEPKLAADDLRCLGEAYVSGAYVLILADQPEPARFAMEQIWEAARRSRN